MLIREELEEFEKKTLSPFAQLSSQSRGREIEEKECDLRTKFQRDKDRIVYSKAFRRLKHKTQVFISPEGDHYRTRLTHTLEVTQIARTIARSLRLNEDLTEAIALGHDLGHTPFGHTGEMVLNSICPLGFKHNEQSLRVVEVLERDKGLNLTWEVRDGIRNHTGDVSPGTLEGKIIRFADRIAYINHDIDDAIRGGIIRNEDLPKECLKVLGYSSSERINTMIVNIVEQSKGINDIRMSPQIQKAMNELREYMFQYVYIGSKAKKEEIKAQNIVRQLYSYLKDSVEVLPKEAERLLDKDGFDRVVCDYIAGMTDRYAVKKFREIFIPESWN
ncbi:MAG: deoxyguanosinetriphosphate triphosphohydrolase [Clostridiaceae bacterium]|nr:deoxyguanosinetriphosphate triphosphohydrolase [Clostridiaceae bacterium]